MIKDILSEDNILLNLKVTNWKEAIIESAKPMLNNNIIESSYIEAMINVVEEHGPYIVLGNGLALAHARPEDGVNKLGLSVATLNPPIDFGSEESNYVEIIFCLAAIDSDSHLDMMKLLVDLLNDDVTLSNLKNSNNKDEFKKILFQNYKEG